MAAINKGKLAIPSVDKDVKQLQFSHVTSMNAKRYNTATAEKFGSFL